MPNDQAQNPAGESTFDLTAQPWIPVLLADGSERELSLRELFTRADRIRRLAGDVPTQEFALTRLLLAVVHDALDGPGDHDDWAELWEDPAPFAPVLPYLERHRARFDLLHPVAPFFQTAGLRTAKDEVFALNRIVADVPNGNPFFTARFPGVGRITFAEAARWVVHAQAYDTSGIKTGVIGDPRAKAGKAYPQGTAWAGCLGGVLAEGENLRETLLLNLLACDHWSSTRGDVPAWRRDPDGPGAAGNLASRPAGPRDLYTWQSRRIRLHADAAGVHGVVLTYGDPLAPQNMHTIEPMTGWRRSQAQEKKQGLPLVYMPREHDPARAAWRGLGSLTASAAPASAPAGNRPRSCAPGWCTGWRGWRRSRSSRRAGGCGCGRSAWSTAPSSPWWTRSPPTRWTSRSSCSARRTSAWGGRRWTRSAMRTSPYGPWATLPPTSHGLRAASRRPPGSPPGTQASVPSTARTGSGWPPSATAMTRLPCAPPGSVGCEPRSAAWPTT